MKVTNGAIVKTPKFANTHPDGWIMEADNRWRWYATERAAQIAARSISASGDPKVFRVSRNAAGHGRCLDNIDLMPSFRSLSFEFDEHIRTAIDQMVEAERLGELPPDVDIDSASNWSPAEWDSYLGTNYCNQFNDMLREERRASVEYEADQGGSAAGAAMRFVREGNRNGFRHYWGEALESFRLVAYWTESEEVRSALRTSMKIANWGDGWEPRGDFPQAVENLLDAALAAARNI